MTGYESKKDMAQDKLDNMEREALKLALKEYLCREMPAGTVIGDPKFWVPRIATAIKEALAQPAQEPVREALKLALKVLKDLPGYRADIDNAITELEEALAQPAQELVNLIARTGDGRIVAPILTTSYACKSCGFANNLIQGNGQNFMRVPIGVTHESLCHACDDVEMVTWELDTHSLMVKLPQRRRTMDKPIAWLEPEWGEKICPEVGYEVTMTDDHPRDLGWIPLVAQRTWVGLTKEDMPDGENPMFDHEYFIAGMVFAANILKEKNT